MDVRRRERLPGDISPDCGRERGLVTQLEREWVLKGAWLTAWAGGLLKVGSASEFGAGGKRIRERSPSEADLKSSTLTTDSELKETLLSAREQ